jgi:glucan biosynthesis protein C
MAIQTPYPFITVRNSYLSKPVPSPQRIYYLDNLKILLAAIVVLLHAGQPYGPGGDWPIPQPPVIPLENLIVIGMFFAVSASFFMGLFFFISAYLVPGSVDRKGTRRFLRDRLIRLGIPLLVLSLTILPLITYIFYVPPGIPFTDYYLHGTIVATGNLETFSFGYLWFVVVLLLFALLYTVGRSTGRTVPPIPLPRQSILLLSVGALGVVTFLVRIGFPLNEWVLFHSIEPAHLPQYLFLLGAGILAFRNRWLEALPSSVYRLWRNIVVVGILILPAGFLLGGDPEGGWSLMSLISSMWEAFVGIGMCFVLIVLFQKHLNRSGPIRRVMAENVFAVYLIHLPIVLALQWVLIPVGIPSLGKFFLVGATGIPLCFLISQFLVRRIPYANRVIF